MDAFKKTFKTSRGYTYTYYISPGSKSLPVLLFQHGHPEHALGWKNIIIPLRRSLNHTIIIPDMLGYGESDKPTDPAAYRWDGMTADLLEIVDNSFGKDSKIVSIGHDFGAACASRVYNYHRDRIIGVISLNVPYMPPNFEKYDLAVANAMAEKLYGFPLFSYWAFFGAKDGGSVMNKNLERMFHAVHGQGPRMRALFVTPGAFREYLLNGRAEDIPLKGYAQQPAFKKAFLERFARDGFEGPQCWYRAIVENEQYESDRQLPREAAVIGVPILYVPCSQDLMFRPNALKELKEAGLLPLVDEAEPVDCGHFCMYEKPEEIANKIEGWVRQKFGWAGEHRHT